MSDWKPFPPAKPPTTRSFPFHLTCLLVPKTPAIFFCFTSPTMIYNWYSTRFSSVALETHTLGCHPGVSNAILMPFVFLDKWQFYCFYWLYLAFPMILHSPITVTMTITTVVNSIKAGVILSRFMMTRCGFTVKKLIYLGQHGSSKFKSHWRS